MLSMFRSVTPAVLCSGKMACRSRIWLGDLVPPHNPQAPFLVPDPMRISFVENHFCFLSLTCSSAEGFMSECRKAVFPPFSPLPNKAKQVYSMLLHASCLRSWYDFARWTRFVLERTLASLHVPGMPRPCGAVPGLTTYGVATALQRR